MSHLVDIEQWQKISDIITKTLSDPKGDTEEIDQIMQLRNNNNLQ